MIVSFEESVHSKGFHLARPQSIPELSSLCQYLTDLGIEFSREPDIDDWTGEPKEWDTCNVPVQLISGLSEYEVTRLLRVLIRYEFRHRVEVSVLSDQKYLTIKIYGEGESDETEIRFKDL